VTYVVNKPGNIGRRGEHAARKKLTVLWPDVNRDDVSKQDPVRDLAHTGQWVVQVKARKTWNIKDVVRHMEEWMKGDARPWMIVYMDSDRRKRDNPKGMYAILPLDTVIALIAATQEGE
jgi:hypothetical protein